MDGEGIRAPSGHRKTPDREGCPGWGGCGRRAGLGGEVGDGEGYADAERNEHEQGDFTNGEVDGRGKIMHGGYSERLDCQGESYTKKRPMQRLDCMGRQASRA